MTKKSSDVWVTVSRWVDSHFGVESIDESDAHVDWFRCLPFIATHVACLAVFWVGWSWIAVAVAAALYWIRMFGITGFYHRYFSHRTFRTSRFAQFGFAVLGASSAQRGPLWWAAHHRHHHQHSDEEVDAHSPVQHGLVWSHMGWFTSRSNFRSRLELVRDFAKFPELVWLDRFDTVVPGLLLIGMFSLGEALRLWFPGLQTSGLQMVVWGFFVSTIVLFHGTSLINSLAHVIGRQRYSTGDNSRNSLILALVTMGEGWHNNHHFYPSATRQGFRWWQVDMTYYGLWFLQRIGLIWDLRPVPARVVHSDSRP